MTYFSIVQTVQSWLAKQQFAKVITANGRRYIKSVVSQQVGQANVNGTKLANMPIILPPLEEQRQIVAKDEHRLSVADEIEKELDGALVRAEKLWGSACPANVVPRDFEVRV